MLEPLKLPEFDFTVLDPPRRKFGGKQPGAGRKRSKTPSLDQVYPGLPDSKNSAADALWAYNNSERMCQRLKDGTTIVWWDRASEPPPSRGVELWLKLRVETPIKDFTDRLARAMSGHDDEEDEADVQKYEKKRLADVRKILEEMMQ